MEKKKYSIALWTPLPPLKTGIADYVAELLPFLDEKFDMEVFVDDNYQVDSKLSERYRIFPYTYYSERVKVGGFDLDVYQMGNNTFHLFIYEQALRKPGLVVLHDLSISFILYHYYVGMRNDLETFKSELVRSEGEDAVLGFDRFFNAGDNDGLMDFFSQKHMLRRLVDGNFAVLSHLEYGARVAKEKYGARRAYSMYLGSPDPFDELGGDIAPSQARQELDLPQDSFVIGTFGHLQANKQNDVAIRALAKVCAKRPNVQMAFVGEINPANHFDEYLNGLIEKYDLSKNVRITGFVSREIMQKYYVACDVIVNLRYPSFGQMSATLSRGIATGKPAIITDLPDWDFFPEDFCWRVDPKDVNGNQLAEQLIRLIDNPKILKERSLAARRYFVENGSTRKAAENLSQIVKDIVQNAPKDIEVEPYLLEKITISERIANAFRRWDNSRSGEDRHLRLDKLRRIPILGNLMVAVYRLFTNAFKIREIRRAEWSFNNALVDSLFRLDTLNSKRDEDYQQIIKALQAIKDVAASASSMPAEARTADPALAENLAAALQSIPDLQKAVQPIPDLQLAVQPIPDLQKAAQAIEELQKTVKPLPELIKAMNDISEIKKVIQPVPELVAAVQSISGLEKAVQSIPDLENAVQSIPEMEKAVQAIPDLKKAVQEIPALKQADREFRQHFELVYKAEPLRVLENPLASVKGYDLRPKSDDPYQIDDESFYIAFEQAFRGSQETIRKRQALVFSEIKKFTALPINASILDVGCGRGEFLRLLKEEGFHPIGVDTNATLVAGLRKQGFESYSDDVFSYLDKLPDGKLRGITAFHVIEHLDHKQHMAFFNLAYRKLMDGGFIYVETPNPLCPDSLSRFYSDPTHQRPLQPFQLSFLMEYNYFTNLKALFMEPVPARGSLSSERWITLYQDFGIIALKSKETE